jgi:predicted dehydrogenase
MDVRVGLIGAGFVARCHIYGYRAMPAVFPDAAARPALELVCDATEALAAAAAARFGFRRSTGDWRRLVEDPEVDVVDICVPSNLHKPIALAAIAAGKHLYAEKPVGLDAVEARQIAKAAADAGVKHLTGYTYLRNPLIGLARKLIDEGAIGRVIHFRGAHNEDYLADPSVPFPWRCDPAIAGKAGALGDLGSHIIAIARHLVGELEAVCGMARRVYPLRPVAPGAAEMLGVGNDDEAQFMMIFRNGAAGHIETSRIATGSHMDITYEITGTEGALHFDGERMNELRVYSTQDPADRRGFRRVYASPEHPPYGNFTPGAAHGLGFNDHKVIEVWELMQLVATGRPPLTDLSDAVVIARVLDAVLLSAAERRWVTIERS